MTLSWEAGNKCSRVEFRENAVEVAMPETLGTFHSKIWALFKLFSILSVVTVTDQCSQELESEDKVVPNKEPSAWTGALPGSRLSP